MNRFTDTELADSRPVITFSNVMVCGFRSSFLSSILITSQQAMYSERDSVLAIPSVRLSVCLSNAGSLSKRMDVSTKFSTV